MAERDARQPVDADMDVRGGLLPTRDVEVAAARRAGADEDRVVVLDEERFEAVDVLAEPGLDAEIEEIADLLVDDRFGEAEFRDLAADHAPGAPVAVIDNDLITERRQIARDSERGRAAANEGDALA